MTNFEDILDDVGDKAEALNAVRDGESGVVLWYDEEGRMHLKRFGLTWSAYAYLLVCANAMLHEDIVKQEVE